MDDGEEGGEGADFSVWGGGGGGVGKGDDVVMVVVVVWWVSKVF